MHVAALTNIVDCCSLSCCLPYDSCICPKTCNLGLISCTRSYKALQPTCSFRRVESRIPYGGPCVIKISVSNGILFHIERISSLSRLALNAHAQNSGCHGLNKTTRISFDFVL